MKIKVNENLKMVELWLCNNENLTKDLPKSIEGEIEQYKNLNYKICVFKSGNEDIKKNLLSLIINNAG